MFKKFFFAVLLVLCLVVCVSICKTASDEKYRVAIELMTKKTKYFVMEPIFCQVKLKNTGVEPVYGYYGSVGDRYPYTFVVKDSKGQLMSETNYSIEQKKKAERVKKVWSGSQPIEPDLQVGKVSSEKIILNQYVDLTANDSDYYDIQIERFGTLSNTLRIQLVSKDFDIDDKEVQDALRTGYYNGQTLLRNAKK